MNSRKPMVEAYGGVSGRVLREAMSGASLITGLSLILSLGALSYIMGKFHADDAFAVLLHLTIIGVLARFAVNGYAGEWGGTVFSDGGGSWIEVGAVSLRYFALSLIWLVPAIILGFRPDTVNAAMGQAFLGGGSKWLILTAFVMTVVALTPPVFLIVSVGAVRFRDIVDADHWRTLFRGRTGDLFLIYALYLGALAMTAVLVLPFLVAVAAKNQDVATVMGLGCLAFAGGLAVNLLGRLCGFFAATAFPAGDVTGETAEMMGLGPDGGGSSGPASPRTPEASPQPQVPGMIPGWLEELGHDTAAPAPAGATGSDPAASDGVGGPGGTGVQEEEGVPAEPGGKTPLLEAGARVDELAERFSADPAGAIGSLMELREEYAPNPQVLHMLSMCLLRAGQIEDSLEVALEALPLCLNRGAIRLASELYGAHLRNADRLGLVPDVILAISDELRRMGDLPAAEHAYMKVLAANSRETRALKGLLQLAEQHLHDSEYAEAARIYEVLLECCGDSPFVPHMQEGLAEARRRMAKAG